MSELRKKVGEHRTTWYRRLYAAKVAESLGYDQISRRAGISEVDARQYVHLGAMSMRKR